MSSKLSLAHFLFNENLTPLRQRIDEIIEETNTEYNTKFDFSIIHNRKIK